MGIVNKDIKLLLRLSTLFLIWYYFLIEMRVIKDRNIHTPYSKIEVFCKKWKIIELSIFGSSLRKDFAPESDVDILVKFGHDTRYSLFDLTNMEDELKEIFGREVDLVERKAVEKSKNYIRRDHILKSLKVLYVAR